MKISDEGEACFDKQVGFMLSYKGLKLNLRERDRVLAPPCGFHVGMALLQLDLPAF